MTWEDGDDSTPDYTECPYFRGVGTCSFGCWDEPACLTSFDPPEGLVGVFSTGEQQETL